MRSEKHRVRLDAHDHLRRARKRSALPPDADAASINRAFAKLAREAKRLRMAIDHVIPLAGCRVCGAKGLHVESNWAMLPKSVNSAKGNRCMSCYMSELGRPIIVWVPARVRRVVQRVAQRKEIYDDIHI
jgi:hypothetical protein